MLATLLGRISRPVNVITDHKNLEYFCTTKILTRRQARWSEHLSQINLIICFRPGHLGIKPDSLTRRWDVYLKEGTSDYATVNLQNLRPIFSQHQLALSLRATKLAEPILQATSLMDTERIITNIRQNLVFDPLTQKHLGSTEDPKWQTNPDSLLLFDRRIYVPEIQDIRLQVLRFKHDHILSGHFGINKTLELVRWDFNWPGIKSYIKDYCKSSTTCMHSKPQWHKPYGLLKQLPVPEKPWNSISMDFIEQLPASSELTAILVIVNCFSKQGIFIPTTDMITLPKLAELFVLHIFSKHGIPSHVTSDRGSEFVSHFWRSLGKALT